MELPLLGAAPALHADAELPVPRCRKAAAAHLAGGVLGWRPDLLRTGSSWGPGGPEPAWPRNAAERPLVCLIDDAQWLDEALLPGARVSSDGGLLAEPVGLLIGVREAAGEGATSPACPALTVRRAYRRGRAGSADGRGSPGHLDNRVSRPDRRRDRGKPAGAAGAGHRDERSRAGRPAFADPPQGQPCPGHLPGQASRTTTCAGFRCCLRQPQQLMLLAAADPTGGRHAAVACRTDARTGT